MDEENKGGVAAKSHAVRGGEDTGVAHARGQEKNEAKGQEEEMKTFEMHNGDVAEDTGRSSWEMAVSQRDFRVLLVEDDDCTRHVVRALLRNCNYNVTPAQNGLQAWDMLESGLHQFDLVLTDVVMPGLSGLGLLVRILGHSQYKRMPVVMMSSRDSMDLVLTCFQKGAVDFLVKPVRKNELRNLWQHVWRKNLCSTGSGCGSACGSKKDLKVVRGGSPQVREMISGNGSDDGNSGSGTDSSLNVRRSSDNGSGTQMDAPTSTPHLCEKAAQVHLSKGAKEGQAAGASGGESNEQAEEPEGESDNTEKPKAHPPAVVAGDLSTMHHSPSDICDPRPPGTSVPESASDPAVCASSALERHHFARDDEAGQAGSESPCKAESSGAGVEAIDLLATVGKGACQMIEGRSDGEAATDRGEKGTDGEDGMMGGSCEEAMLDSGGSNSPKGEGETNDPSGSDPGLTLTLKRQREEEEGVEDRQTVQPSGGSAFTRYSTSGLTHATGTPVSISIPSPTNAPAPFSTSGNPLSYAPSPQCRPFDHHPSPLQTADLASKQADGESCHGAGSLPSGFSREYILSPRNTSAAPAAPTAPTATAATQMGTEGSLPEEGGPSQPGGSHHGGSQLGSHLISPPANLSAELAGTAAGMRAALHGSPAFFGGDTPPYFSGHMAPRGAYQGTFSTNWNAPAPANLEAPERDSQHIASYNQPAYTETVETVTTIGPGQQHHHHHHHHHHHMHHPTVSRPIVKTPHENVTNGEMPAEATPEKGADPGSSCHGNGSIVNASSANGSASGSNTGGFAPTGYGSGVVNGGGSGAGNSSPWQGGADGSAQPPGASEGVEGWGMWRAGSGGVENAAFTAKDGNGNPGLDLGSHRDRSAWRAAALNKFRQKRKERNFEKKVRYQSRKRLAEARPRVRGQFVRQPASLPSEEQMEYDQMSPSYREPCL
eukprot:TRINITY_DN22136_c0_g1_i1.p1 TRINITY_DN22136_c0_g1~~TRINITY_DN22136_c0_g1_i1.p1  ORF type:complete len:942 (-),score=165.94 TRINITY_DN22136_c0_g1_i1:1510-4335(-)